VGWAARILPEAATLVGTLVAWVAEHMLGLGQVADPLCTEVEDVAGHPLI